MFTLPTTLTAANARTVLAAGLQAIADGQTMIDVGALTDVDSVAVATLVAWQRAARQRGTAVDFGRLPSNLLSLAELYGVAALLGTAAI